MRVRVRLLDAVFDSAHLVWCIFKRFVSFEMEMIKRPFEKWGEPIDCFPSSSLIVI